MAQVAPDKEFDLQQLARTLCHYGLRLPALLSFRAGQPLTFLGAQLLWLAQPTLSLLFPRQHISQIAHILEDPTAVARLVTLLEAQNDS